MEGSGQRTGDSLIKLTEEDRCEVELAAIDRWSWISKGEGRIENEAAEVAEAKCGGGGEVAEEAATGSSLAQGFGFTPGVYRGCEILESQSR